jgi:hypothetical protein
MDCRGRSRIFDCPRSRCIICRSSHRRRLSARNVEFGREAVGKRYCIEGGDPSRKCIDKAVFLSSHEIPPLNGGFSWYAADAEGAVLPRDLHAPEATPWDPALQEDFGEERRIVHLERPLPGLIGISIT